MLENIEHSDNHLYELVYRDELTGLHNRRFFVEQTERDSYSLMENPSDYALLMFDIDHFKGINDTYGHQEGDYVIKTVANAVTDAVGKKGTPIRFAGDEFLLMMPHITKDVALNTAWILRDYMADNVISLSSSDSTIKVTLSIGVAHYPDDTEDFKELMHIADQAAYISKKKGRNTVSSLDSKSTQLIDLNYLHLLFPCRKHIGRVELLQQLKESAIPARGSIKKITVVEGVRGIGKSRIISEMAHSLDPQRYLHIRCHSQPMTSAQPFWDIIDTLNKIFSEDSELTSFVSNKLSADKLKELVPLMPIFSQFILHDTKKRELSPEQRRDLMLEALEELLLAINSEKPIIISIDDFQWSNFGTQILLERLKSNEKAQEIPVIITIDSTDLASQNDAEFLVYLDTMNNKNLLNTLEINPLSDEEVDSMLLSIIPGIGEAQKIKTVLREQGRGTPLYIEDILKHLICNNIIHSESEGIIVEEFDSAIVPHRIEEAVHTGVSTLDDEVRGLLCKASVIGERFSVDLLRRVDGRSEGYINDLIVKAQKASLIESDPGSTGDSFVFVGKNTHNSFYDSIDEDKRKTFHRELAELEKDIHKDDIETVLSKISYHFKQSGDLEQSQKYFNKLLDNYQSIIPPKVINLYIDKAPPRKDWGEERPLKPEEEEIAFRFIKLIQVTLRNIEQFPIDSEIVKSSFESTYFELKKVFSMVDVLSFADGDGEILLNGRRPASSSLDTAACEQFLKTLNSAGLKGVTIHKEVTREHFLQFLKTAILENHDEIQNEGGWRKVLAELGIDSILTNERIFVALSERDLFDSRKMKDEIQAIEIKESKPQAISIPEITAGMGEESEFLIKTFYEELLELKEKIVEEGNWGEDIGKVQELLSKIFQKHGIIEEFIGKLKPHVEQLEKDLVEKVKAQEISQAEAIPEAAEKVMSAETMNAARKIDLLTFTKLKVDAEVLVKDLESRDDDISGSAAIAIVNKGIVTVPVLQNYMVSTDSVLGRKRAFHILRKIMPRIDTMLVQDMVSKTSSEEKRRLLEILHDFSDIDITDCIRLFLRSSEYEIRQAVISLILARYNERSIQLLIDVLHEKPSEDNTGILKDSIDALGKLKAKEAVPFLISMIRKRTIFANDPNQEIQEYACSALGKMGDSRAIIPLINALKTTLPFMFIRNKSNRVRAAAAFALSNFPTPEVLSILQRAAKDPMTDVRSAASLALHTVQKTIPTRSGDLFSKKE
ncbi:MAG: diguanylate cyclase [Vulcanimicrobiota bacterium]